MFQKVPYKLLFDCSKVRSDRPKGVVANRMKPKVASSVKSIPVRGVNCFMFRAKGIGDAGCFDWHRKAKQVYIADSVLTGHDAFAIKAVPKLNWHYADAIRVPIEVRTVRIQVFGVDDIVMSIPDDVVASSFMQASVSGLIPEGLFSLVVVEEFNGIICKSLRLNNGPLQKWAVFPVEIDEQFPVCVRLVEKTLNCNSRQFVAFEYRHYDGELHFFIPP